MKTYYDRNGDIDVGKTLWTFIQKSIRVITIICVISLAHYYINKPKIPDINPNPWKNWDESHTLFDVAGYDYDNSLIIYRPQGNAQRQYTKQSRTFESESGIKLKGTVNITLDNDAIRDLVEEVFSNGDYYEFYEQYMD